MLLLFDLRTDTSTPMLINGHAPKRWRRVLPTQIVHDFVSLTVSSNSDPVSPGLLHSTSSISPLTPRCAPLWEVAQVAHAKPSPPRAGVCAYCGSSGRGDISPMRTARSVPSRKDRPPGCETLDRTLPTETGVLHY